MWSLKARKKAREAPENEDGNPVFKAETFGEGRGKILGEAGPKGAENPGKPAFERRWLWKTHKGGPRVNRWRRREVGRSVGLVFGRFSYLRY